MKALRTALISLVIGIILPIAVAACVGGGGGTGRGGGGIGGSSHDLKHVPFYSPDYAVGYNNVDGHPNFVILCVMGEAYLTTTRDFTSKERKAEWDYGQPNAVCPAPVKHTGLTPR